MDVEEGLIGGKMIRYCFRLRNLRSIAVVFLSLGILAACDPVPGRTLNSDEKEADMRAIFTWFEEYYTPLAYKQQRFNFDYETLKTEALAKARATEDNEAFYRVVHEFVANFQDAHTSAALTNAKLPGRVEIAFLGFSGRRAGHALLVNDIMPLMNPEQSSYPIEVGDLITAIDGVALPRFVLENLTKSRNLGNPESNITALMNRTFNRSTLHGNMPTSDTVTLTLEREGVTKTVRMPWIRRDLFELSKDLAVDAAAKEAAGKKKKKKEKTSNALSIRTPQGPVTLTLEGLQGRPFQLDQIKQQLESTSGEPRFSRFYKSFQIANEFTGWKVLKAGAQQPTEWETFEKERVVPEFAIRSPKSEIFPAYVINNPGRPVGVVRISTFSTGETTEKCIAEIQETLRFFQHHGVGDIVIDMIDNGGGSLDLVLKLAQAFSRERLEFPGVQFGLNENWMSDMHSAAVSSPSHLDREHFRRVYADLLAQRNAGARVSKTYDIVDMLMPFEVEGNASVTRRFNIALLQDEMCASAADIFSYMLKRNTEIGKMNATLIGQQTMGAGGNVVKHWQTPNAHIDLHQTESLFVKADGTYLENNGIEADITTPVSLHAQTQYRSLYTMALETLLQQKTAKRFRQIDPDAVKRGDPLTEPKTALSKKCDRLLSAPRRPKAA